MSTPDYSGYHDCPCRDCFEIAIGEDEDGGPALCWECEESGCSAEGDEDCQSPRAYGVCDCGCEECETCNEAKGAI